MLFYVLLVFFLLANIIVAYRAARHSTGTIQDFIATKKLSTATLVMTLFATLMDGSNVGLRYGYATGLIIFFFPLCFSISTLLFGYFIFPKLADSKKYTLADFVGSKYGRAAGVFTLLISTLFSLLIMTAQLKKIGQLSAIIEIERPLLIVMIGLLVTFYTSLGGMRAVAMTDVLQCFVMGGGLVFFSLFVIYKHGGFAFIIKTLASRASTEEHIYVYKHTLWKNGLKQALFFWDLFPILLISPPVIQRVLMASNKRKVKSMFTSFSVLYLFLRIFPLFVGLAAAMKATKIKDRLPLGEIIRMVCSHHLMQLLFVLALLAITMSTFDSFLHALVSMWMYDFFRLIVPSKKNFIPKARWLALFIGLSATFSVTFFHDIKFFDLVESSMILFSVITIPFLCSIFGLKVHAKAFWSSVVVFGIIFPLFYWLAEADVLHGFMYNFGLLKTRPGFQENKLSLRASWFCSMFVSMLVFFFVVYHQAGGFIFLKQTKEGFEKQSKYRFNLHFLGNPAAWATKKARRYGRKGFLVGFFILLHFFIPHKLGQINDANTDIFIAFLRVIGIFLAMVLWSRIIWYRSMRKYFDLFYYVTIFFCFAFVSTFTFLQDAGTTAAIIHLVVGLTTLAMLVDLPTFLGFATLGLGASLLTHYAWHGSMAGIGLSWLYSFVPVFAYTLFLVKFVAKEKDKVFRERAKRAEMEAILRKNPLGGYLDSKKQISELLDHSNKTMQSILLGLEDVNKNLSKEARQERANQAKEAIEQVQKTIKDALNFTPIHVQPIQLDVFLDRLRLYLKTYDIDPGDDILLEKKCKNQTLVFDPILLRNVLGQALLHLHQVRPNHKALFTIQNTYLPSKHNQSLPAISFTITYEKDPIYDGELVRHASGFDYLIANNQQIIHAHDGTCKQEVDYLHYVIPKNVKQV